MILETNRLKLRAVELADANILFEYRSDTKANQFQGFIPSKKEDMIGFLKKVNPKINQPGSWFQFVIISKKLNVIIGDMGIHFFSDDHHQVEFGITLNKKCQKKGYAAEAINCVFGFLFTELNKHRIIASVDPRNTNSIQLLERLNMRKEAYFVKSLFYKGEWIDNVIYALLKSEYNPTITKLD